MTEMNTALRLRSSADGWRGVIGESFTPASAGLLAGCVVEVVASSPRVLVTHDGRRFGAQAAQAVVRAAQAAGARQVRLVPHLPTPTATAAVRLGEADLALLVTASHNPPRWNGLKVKAAPGCPPPKAVERATDELFGRRLQDALAGTGTDADPVAEAESGDAVVGRHIEDVLSRLPRRPTRRLSVVVDGLGGIAGGPTARLCSELNWDVHAVGHLPAPDFGGLVPDPSVPASRRRVTGEVLDRGADLGIVLDGDGDRVYVVDERGRTVQSHELLALLLEHRHRAGYGTPRRGVAVTASAGTAVRRVARWIGAPVKEFGIGFKHLSPQLAAGLADAAGGSVGDLAFAEYGVDRDPFAAIALFADLLGATELSVASLLDDLRARVGDLSWFEAKVDGVADNAALREAGLKALAESRLDRSVSAVTETDGVKFWLGRGQWLLLRPSSTEGGVRIYGEFLAESAADGLVQRVVEAVGTGLS
uniref:Phosphoglucomutase n=1 Tax=Streptomyces citricolor TaxID=212427 RepID=A0A1B4ZC97_9ACTN|nr:phosphoglucomutase [Streptomyces citricolor]BAV57063.1 phosphoglucomutase [Streptomyces citricolor]